MATTRRPRWIERLSAPKGCHRKRPAAAQRKIVPGAPGSRYDSGRRRQRCHPRQSANALENALIDEERITVQAISDLALRIRRSQKFGGKVLDRMYALHPHLETADDKKQLYMARLKVENFVDDQRIQWANEWLYFGNLPPNTPMLEMARRIEREIWSIWITDQDFKMYSEQKGGFQGEVDGTWDEVYAEGRDKIRFTYDIVERLIELDVIAPQTAKQRQRSQTRADRQNPSVTFHMELDDERELSAIDHWAEHHPVEMISGKFDHIRRAIPHITEVHRAG